LTRLVAAALVLALPATAAAHSFSVAYSDVVIDADRTAATYQLRINYVDVAELLGEPADSVPTDLKVLGNAETLFHYATQRIALEGDGKSCLASLEVVDVVEQTDKFARIEWRCSWDHAIEVFAIEYDLFYDVDPNHTGMFRVSHHSQHATGILVADASRFEWELGEPPPDTLGEFVLAGVDHILFGPDHILFLLGLLLVAALVGLKHTLTIVTSFTVAHSCTLIAAALGWFTLPSRFVESVIALSIVWVAAENLLLDKRSYRWILTFGFGLIHGLGFASMLTPLLPDSGVVLPLLAFNVGVELGQLAIVAVSFPLLLLAVRHLGAARYRRWLVWPGSLAVGAMGLVWLAQRI